MPSSPDLSSATNRPDVRRTRLHLVALFLLWAVVYIPGLFSPALLDDADSVHAEAAREILVRHDWITLHANGIRYLEKAPLLYWSMAASFLAFGVSEWSARLPLALAILALMMEIYRLGRWAWGGRAGFYAAIVIATGFGPYLFTRILIPDLLVGLWLTLGFDFFLQALEQTRPSRLSCWGFAAAAALNVLTKGLIGLVFPGVVIVLFLILTHNLGRLARLRPISSTLVFLTIAAPWHVLAGLANPSQGNLRGFFWFYFVNEHFLRYLNKRVPRDYDTVPLLVFWALVILWLIPWSAFLPPAVWQFPRRLRSLTREQSATLLCLIWALVILGFFSFSTRQEYYVLPALPALALLLGQWLAREAEAPVDHPLRRSGRRSAAFLFAVGISGAFAAFGLLILSKPAPAGIELADLLRKNPGEYALSLGHIFDLTPQALGRFRGPLLGTAMALLLGTALGWWFRRQHSPAKGNAALSFMMIVILFCSWLGLREFAPILSSKKLASAISSVYHPGELIVINGEYEAGSTLNFYTGQQVHILNGRSSNLWYGSFFPDAPAIFEDDASFARLWAGPRRVYLWTDQRYPRQLAGATAYELAHSGGKFIFTNQPLPPRNQERSALPNSVSAPLCHLERGSGAPSPIRVERPFVLPFVIS